MSRLLVLRHAATAWNEAGRLQGRSDPPLSPAGRAAAAGWRLPPPPGGCARWRVYCSPLTRARQTAEAMGLAPVAAPELIEMSWGRWEGETLAALRDRLGPALAENEARGLDFRPEGGESPREVMARLRPFLARLAGAGEPAVAVTHKGVLRALLAIATGWSFRGRAPARPGAGSALLFGLGPDGGLALLDGAIRLGAETETPGTGTPGTESATPGADA